MAGETGILAQSNPSASTLTDVLTVAGSSERVARFYICNQGSGSAAVRLAISPGGAAIDASHYLVYDYVLGPGRTLDLDFPKGLKLGIGTIVRGYADTSTVSFNVISE